MRILLLTAKCPPLVCGVGDHTVKLAEELTRLGHRIWILTSALGNGPAESEVQGEWMVLRKIYRWDFSAFREILNQIRQNQIDLVHLMYHPFAFESPSIVPFLTWWLRRASPPFQGKVVVTLHELAGPWWPIFRGLYLRCALTFLVFASSFSIVTNDRDFQRLNRIPFLRGKLRQIPLGSSIDLKEISLEERRRIRQQLGLKEGEFLAVRFGFLHNVRLSLLGQLLKAIQKVIQAGHPVKLLLLGEAPAEPRRHVQQMARKLGLEERMIFMGFQLPEAVSQYLQCADLAVQPYPEGVSERRGTLQAAMLHRLPIVSTRSNGTPSFFRDQENILLIPVGDSAAMARAIIRLIEYPALRERLSRGIQALAADFDWQTIAQATDRLYRSLAP